MIKNKRARKALTKLWSNPNDSYAVSVLMQEAGFDGAEERAIMQAWGHVMRKPETSYYSRRSFEQVPGMINAWRQRSDHLYESWSIVLVFEGADTEQVRDDLESAGYAVDGYSSHYAGQPYARPMYIREVGANRILVTQWGGLDV